MGGGGWGGGCRRPPARPAACPHARINTHAHIMRARAGRAQVLRQQVEACSSLPAPHVHAGCTDACMRAPCAQVRGYMASDPAQAPLELDFGTQVQAIADLTQASAARTPAREPPRLPVGVQESLCSHAHRAPTPSACAVQRLLVVYESGCVSCGGVCSPQRVWRWPCCQRRLVHTQHGQQPPPRHHRRTTNATHALQQSFCAAP